MTRGEDGKKIPLEGLVELMPAMVGLYNINTGKYIYVNKEIIRMLGYSPAEFIKKGIKFVASLVHPDDLIRITEQNRAALDSANEKKNRTNNEPVATFEYRMRHKKGHWVWLQTEGIVYDRTREGKVNHVMNVSLDISEQKKKELSTKKIAAELKNLGKSRDDFITIASHQLRTPATAIKQYLGLLLGGYSDPLTEDQRNFLEKAYESNQRQLNIVEDILRIAQLDADKLRLDLKKEDITKIVDEAIKNIYPQLVKREQVLEWKKPKKVMVSTVDKAQILMVIENILENASHYSEKRKKIKVTAAQTKHDIRISISDEGVGIDKNDLKKLFKKFSRINNPLTVEAGGTGLGLYWANKIVKMHGGEILVHNLRPAGTEFIVVLPLN